MMMRRRWFGIVVAAAALMAWTLAATALRRGHGGAAHRERRRHGVRALSRCRAQTAPMLLLFHQAGSNKDEYAPIQPWLAARALRIAGNRSSGQVGRFWEGERDRVRPWRPWRHLRRGLRRSGDCPCLGARAASVATGRALRQQLFRRAGVPAGRRAPKPDHRYLAFSPGEYLDRSAQSPVQRRKSKWPVRDLGTEKAEKAAAAAILSAVPAKPKQQYLPTDGGVHGRRNSRDDANPTGLQPSGQDVLTFLRETFDSAVGTWANARP